MMGLMAVVGGLVFGCRLGSVGRCLFEEVRDAGGIGNGSFVEEGYDV